MPIVSQYEQKAETKPVAEKVLEKYKEVESKTTFFSRRINKNTIVYCKNEDRLNDYEESYNNIKNW